MAAAPMRLLWSSRSPFARKVMIAAHEVGLADRIVTERVVVSADKPNANVMAINPLNKIPTLVLADGRALYDSRVICEYFDTLHDGARLFPIEETARWAALQRQALGDGLLDVLILRLVEQNRAAAVQSESHLAAYRLKAATALDRIEATGIPPAERLDIGHVAIASALGYLDFRFAKDNWRTNRPALSSWYAGVARRPSMTATEHADTY